jgi:hypothetical protein
MIMSEVEVGCFILLSLYISPPPPPPKKANRACKRLYPFGPQEGGQSASPAAEGKCFDIKAWKMHIYVVDSRRLLKT